MEERVFKGRNGDLVISDAGVRITGGVKRSVMTGRLRGEKFIPWESIVAAQYRKANFLTVGYLQLSLQGGREAKAGLKEAVNDENTVTWGPTAKNQEFAQARDIILARIDPATDTKMCPECAERVKSAAKVCRFCGYRFDAEVA